jgi:ribosome biogenesis GTPase
MAARQASTQSGRSEGDERHLRVTAAWGRRFRVQTEPGAAQPVDAQARTKGKKLRPVCGDIVAAEPLAGERDWVISGIEPRDNTLTRPDLRGRPETLAANIEVMAIVFATLPAADFFMIDRYLCAAELMPCDAVLVYNKADLAASPPAECDTYRQIGYPVCVCSAEDGTGIDALRAALGPRRAILVGQSGVGKSSLVNALAGGERQRVAGVSEANKEGRHTTVAAELIRLPDGLQLIDSPGVRDYAPSIETLRDVAFGFREIADAAERCKFANCQHRSEPGCAVKAAVEDGAIDRRRYESYLRLANLTRQLAERRGN